MTVGAPFFPQHPPRPSLDRRRFLLISLAAAFATPLAARAQPAAKIYRIGFLRAGQPPDTYLEGLQQGLRERGYAYGQNVVVEVRATDGSFDQLPRFVEELVRLKVDVILASAAPAALAVKREGTSVPVVFVGVVSPVELGLVPSLSRPGGNITGLATTAEDFAGKRLELLRAIVPRLRRVAVLWHPANPTNPIQLKGAEGAARTLGLHLEPVQVQGPDDFDAAGKAVRGADGLLLLESPLFTMHRARFAELAARRGLPAIYGQREYVEVGGLMSYGTHFQDLYRRAALYVDKILKGATPADLPIEQPTKFELVINLKTAKALGLTIPPSLLARADQVIE
jgi:putative tryptophan/tyrosine transport system substrate-binding protein